MKLTTLKLHTYIHQKISKTRKTQPQTRKRYLQHERIVPQNKLRTLTNQWGKKKH